MPTANVALRSAPDARALATVAPGANLVPLARERGVGVIAREPLAQGFLTGKYAADHAFPAGDVRAGWAPDYKLYLSALASKMRAYFHERERLERPLAAIAMQFVLQEDGVSTVIASMKTPAQVAENASVAEMAPLAARHLRWLRE